VVLQFGGWTKFHTRSKQQAPGKSKINGWVNANWRRCGRVRLVLSLLCSNLSYFHSWTWGCLNILFTWAPYGCFSSSSDWCTREKWPWCEESLLFTSFRIATSHLKQFSSVSNNISIRIVTAWTPPIERQNWFKRWHFSSVFGRC
jgi:hypothetical protein